ncbi:MAG: NAD(P)/FAD-dependent oxidoreductase [Chloroflexota bacterium]|nr:NAD(P)/FAD-dependent oxidoreductase [Chloroflexota bacterium]
MARESFDVLIIGSGIGGLSAAALLTSAGYKTLVVEKSPRIGGRYSTIEHKGFKITTGAIEIEMGGVIQKVFDSVGVALDARIASPFCYRLDGKDHVMPAKGGMRAFISALAESEDEANCVMSGLKKAMAWQEPADNITLREWVQQYTENERIVRAFWSLVSPTHFVNDDELSAGKFFAYLKAPKAASVGIAPRGPLELMESLRAGIEAKGGQVWTGCAAAKIAVEDGAAVGAVVKRGGESVDIAAKAVISNAGPRKTVDLAGADNFARWYLNIMDKTLHPAPFIALHASSDEPLVDCDSIVFVLGRRLSCMNTPSIACPELAPKGKHLLMAGGTPLSSLPPYDVKADKEQIVAELKQEIPDFDKRAEMLMVSYFRGDAPGYHSWPGLDMPQKTPIVNLYNVGDGVKPAGWLGLPACAKSAEMVVEDIKWRVKLA